MFPVYHKTCDTCESRFRCFTDKVRKEFDISHGGSDYTMIQPFKFGLACFKVEPYKFVTQMKLHLLPDKTSMALDMSMNW
jgi:hypothetical protein